MEYTACRFHGTDSRPECCKDCFHLRTVIIRIESQDRDRFQITKDGLGRVCIKETKCPAN